MPDFNKGESDNLNSLNYDKGHARDLLFLSDIHYYHSDGLGSIMGMSNGTMLSKVEQSYFYDEFGNSLGSWGGISNHYLYTGQEYDGSISSLYNLRARYYDMRIGRFVQEDDICPFYERPQNLNRYLYVENNSINHIDPLGLWCIYFSTPITISTERIDWGQPTWIFQFAEASGAETGEFAGGISFMINCVWALMQEQLEIGYAN